MKGFRAYIFTLVAGVLAALFVRFFLLTAYKVPTGSMQPALKPGDYIFSYRKAYQFQLPHFLQFASQAQISRGDVIVFYFPSQPQTQYVKRVVGLPGDTIEFDGDFLKINGQSLTYQKISDPENNPNAEAFDVFHESGQGLDHRVILSQQSKGSASPKPKVEALKVPEGQIYVLGDNRDTSDDSRYWGSVPFENVTGQVKMIWMSFDSSGKIRWPRIFASLH